GVPGEAVPERVPVDPEPAAQLLLAGPPAARLEELEHADLPAAGHRPQHHPERGRGLALAVAGVDQHQRGRPAPGRPRRRGHRGFTHVATFPPALSPGSLTRLPGRTGITTMPPPGSSSTRTDAW